jgi:hypothetical protein
MSFLRTLSSLMRTREGLPGRSLIAPSQARLTLKFLVMGFRKKKLQLVGMSILINPIKPRAGMSRDTKRLRPDWLVQQLPRCPRLEVPCSSLGTTFFSTLEICMALCMFVARVADPLSFFLLRRVAGCEIVSNRTSLARFFVGAQSWPRIFVSWRFFP